MNKLLIFLGAFFIFSINNATAQDKWKVLFNKQVILKGSTDQEEVVGTFKARRFKNTDSFVLKYETESSSSAWQRTFYLNKSVSDNLKTITLNNQSGVISINASVVKSAIENKEPLYIYTTSLPKDRAKAAAIRVRRILLCRIEWN